MLRRVFWCGYAIVYDLIWDSPVTAELSAAAQFWLTGTGPVIDLGAGTALMGNGGAQPVIGVDSSAAMLKRAVRRGRLDQAVCAPAEDSGLPDGAGAEVLVCNLLHLHPNPSAVLAEAGRLCAPGGRIVICWPVGALSHKKMLRIDLESGRPAGPSLLADALRRLVGVCANLAGTPRTSVDQVESALKGFEGYRAVADLVLLGCQRMVVLQASPSAVLPEVLPGAQVGQFNLFAELH